MGRLPLLPPAHLRTRALLARAQVDVVLIAMSRPASSPRAPAPPRAQERQSLADARAVVPAHPRGGVMNIQSVIQALLPPNSRHPLHGPSRVDKGADGGGGEAGRGAAAIAAGAAAHGPGTVGAGGAAARSEGRAGWWVARRGACAPGIVWSVDVVPRVAMRTLI